MKKLLVGIGVLALAGCVTPPPTGPSVMALPGTGKSFDEFRHDDHDCRGYAAYQSGAQGADQAARDSTVNSAAVGAIVGTAAGAALGGNGHAALAGAGLGTATGAMVGSSAGAQGTYSVQRRYDNAFTQCMYAKGNKVPMAVAPPRQAASFARTYSTPSRSSTAVTLSTAGPTAVRHENATFSGVSGARRRMDASASVMT